jgi:ATP-dependent Lon protease
LALEQEQPLGDVEIITELPLLAVRDVIIFTDMILPLYIGREKSLAALEAAQETRHQVFLVVQRDQGHDLPGPEDLFRVGTIAQVVRQLKMPDGRQKILVQGLAKAKIAEFLGEEPYFKVRVDLLRQPPVEGDAVELEALLRNAREQSQRILMLRDVLSDEIASLLDGIEDPGRLADLVVSNLRVKIEDAQKVLETTDPVARLRMVNDILTREVKVSAMQAKLDSEAREEMDRTQKEYYLREQLRAIKRELGDESDRDEEAEEYRAKFRKAKLPKEVAAEAGKQLARLEWMHPDAAEASIIRSYLDWIVELPWSVTSRDHLDLIEAKKVLDADHYNLKKVKDRILEYLAVMKLSHRQKGPIICFVGPPGVGKTSLGQSIAKAMGRKFVRLSLGGMKDEAEIRGHRRTYVGALPGRIIQGLKTAGSANPVFMLDEVDKIGNDFRGDPASALLEVLDPEQNSNFSDHYLNLPFDLSKVLFITTANFLDTVPAALEDRMEVINLSGYTAEEKVLISKKHLLPRLIRDHGLDADAVSITDSAIMSLITAHTQEAGLRGLDRKLAAICRKVAREVAEGRGKRFRIGEAQLLKYLGPPQIFPEPKLLEGQTGVATGLAWTETGGELMYVEVRTMPGKGNLSLTGSLGEVMKESAHTSLTYARGQATRLGLARDFFEEMDIHIHVPEGNVPKEGPSAGSALVVALISALTNQPVPRDVAMTGEITLRGQILAIGGLREKSLAAMRAGLKRVIIPRQNQSELEDVEEIPQSIRRKIAFIPVDNIGELVDVVFPDKNFVRPTRAGRVRPRSRKPARGASRGRAVPAA